MLLIAASGVLLFFATQDGNFEISESHNIEASPEVIFNFLNDYKNWAHFGTWNEDETLKMSFPQVTSGVGASYSWKSENSGQGAIETLALESHEKIVQKMVFNGSLQDDGHKVVWNLEPHENGTLVTWSMTGTWSLTEKIIFTFNNIDMENRLSEMFSKNLKSLEKAIQNDLSRHTVQVVGLTNKKGSFYISNSNRTSPENEAATRKQLYERLKLFLESNAITASGPYFTVSQDDIEDENALIITVGIPINDYLMPPENSDIFSGYMEEAAVVKVKLTGNHSYIPDAIEQAEDYILKNNLIKSEKLSTIITFVLSEKESDNPLEWITEILIPIENNTEEVQF